MPEKSASGAVQVAVKTMDGGGEVHLLEPGVREHAVALLCILAYHGYGRLRVRSGRRSISEQSELYGRGRTEEELVAAGVDPRYADPAGAVVTWCRPEDSMHVKGRAIDLGVEVYSESAWSEIGRIAERLGWRWGGRWRVRDYGHFEWPAGYLSREVQ